MRGALFLATVTSLLWRGPILLRWGRLGVAVVGVALSWANLTAAVLWGDPGWAQALWAGTLVFAALAVVRRRGEG